MKLVTVAQMRELEQAAARAGVPEQALMEEAGLIVAQEAWMTVGMMPERRVLVLAGPGNNGGDGLVAARRAAGLGAAVDVYLLRPRPEDDPQWRALLDPPRDAESDADSEVDLMVSGVASDDAQLSTLERLLEGASCVVDALLGTGAGRPIEGDLARVMERLRAARERSVHPELIAVDLPTGVDADTGRADPAAVAADMTVALGHPKVGLFMQPGQQFVGRVVPANIGLPPETEAALPYEEITSGQTRALMPPRPPDAHKGTFGSVVVAAGSRRFPGAARLAAEAAARSGAGLVVLAAPESVQSLLVHGLPDAVHEPLPDTDGALNGASAPALLRALPGAAALLVGPGLSLTAATGEFVRLLLAGLDAVEGLRAAVFDADALNVLATLPGWRRELSLPRVLTPHPGEMARLTGSTTAEVQSNRVHHVVEYAAETDSVVILKGACTIVAAPDGRARISGAANAMLATAGTGDVLAGFVGGLLAQGLEPFDAASAAVYLHAEAGREVERVHGAAAGLAQDLLGAVGESRKLLDGR